MHPFDCNGNRHWLTLAKIGYVSPVFLDEGSHRITVTIDGEDRSFYIKSVDEARSQHESLITALRTFNNI